MAQENIIIGTADAKAGDTLFSAFTKTQNNFTELYGELSAQPENLIVINAEADFSTQDGTTITLLPGYLYQIGASFSTSKRFITSGSIMRGLNSATTLTYTGTGSMFTNTNARFNISNILIDCPNGTVFECVGNDSGNPNHRINAASLIISNCIKLLTSVGAGAQVFELIQVSNITGPIAVTFSGATPAVVYSFSRISFIGTIASSTIFDLGSVVSSEIELSSIVVIGDASTTAISGLVSSGNISANNLGMVDGCNFSTLTTPLAGITDDDIRWVFSDNAGIPDTQPDALSSFHSNATETVITASSTDGSNAVLIAGTWVNVQASHFSATVAGRFTYLGERALKGPVDVSIGMISSGGGSIIVEVYLALNGVPIIDSGIDAAISGSTAANLSIPWQLTFNNGDYVEVYIENQSNTTNIIADHAVLRIL